MSSSSSHSSSESSLASSESSVSTVSSSELSSSSAASGSSYSSSASASTNSASSSSRNASGSERESEEGSVKLSPRINVESNSDSEAQAAQSLTRTMSKTSTNSGRVKQSTTVNHVMSPEQMSQHLSKYRTKSVKELVAERTGQPFQIDESWKTSVAIEGMQVESMARKRWKWAVTQILEQQAAAKQAQEQWLDAADQVKKKKFLARGIHLFALVLLAWEAFWSLIFILAPDIRREREVYENSQIQLLVDLQLFIGVLCMFANVGIVYFLFHILRQDPVMRHSPVSNVVIGKCGVILGYVVQLGYPTDFRSSWLALSIVWAAFGIFVLFYIMWKYQYSTMLKQTASMPSVLRSLLSLRQHAPSKESPMTIGLVESLLDWLSRNKAKKALIPGGANFHYMGLVMLFLLVSMTITAIVTIRTFHVQILPDDTLQKIIADADPLSENVFGREYFWRNTSRLDSPEAGVSRKVLMIIASGLRLDYFNAAMALNIVSAAHRADMKFFTARTQTPSTPVTNWLSLISGVRPETSGYLGNVLPKESAFHTFFHSLKRLGIKRGVAVTPRVSGFVQGTLVPFVGNGIIGPDFTVDEVTEDPWRVLENDERRHSATMSAISDSEPFTFFLTQYLHANSVANHNGIPENLDIADPLDEYAFAVRSLVLRIEQLASVVDANTVIAIVSDHGHISSPRGGFGGVDNNVMNVPFVIYKKGLATLNLPSTTPSIDSLDICSSIAMILGIPIPRHNRGQFVEDLTQLLPDPNNLKRMREDLLIQTASFAKPLLQFLSGGQHSSNEKIDEYVERAFAADTNAELVTQNRGLDDYVEQERDDYAVSTAARNVGVTLVFVLIVMGFMIFVMQVMTLADPFALFSWRLLKTPKLYIANPDVKGFGLSILLCMLHYPLSYMFFFVILYANGYHVFDMALLQTTPMITIYVIAALLPSTIVFYMLQRALILKFHQPEELMYAQRKKNRIYHLINNRINFLFFYSVAFKDFEMAYLSRVYGMTVGCLFASFFILSISKFVFLIPFVFINQFVSEEDWETRFTTLTLLLFSTPMLFLSVWNMLSWSNQRVNADSYHALEERRVHKDRRMKHIEEGEEMSEEQPKQAFKSKALQAGSKYAGIATRRRPNITPEMFDSLEDEIAENQAETHVLRRQIGELDGRLSTVVQEEKSVREKLQQSNDSVTASLQKIFIELKDAVPPEDLPMNEYQELQDELNTGISDLKQVEDMVLDQIRQRNSTIEEADMSQDVLDKYHDLFGNKFSLEHIGMSSNPEMKAQEDFVELKRKHERSLEEYEKLQSRISFYQKHFDTVKVTREEELEQLNDVFLEVINANDRLKNQIVGMIGERNNLLETLKVLKSQRNEVTAAYKREMFHMESKEEHLQEEFALLSDELEMLMQEKETLFKEVAFVSSELQGEKAKLKNTRQEVENYRKLLSRML